VDDPRQSCRSGVIWNPQGQVPEIPQSLSRVHSFAQGQTRGTSNPCPDGVKKRLPAIFNDILTKIVTNKIEKPRIQAS
jgi:hypothetical protein